VGGKIKARVKCRCSYSGCDYPIQATVEGESQSVSAILAEWQSPTAKHYLLQMASGLIMETAYSLLDFCWQVKILSQRVNPT
jgi:hypothetical protein